MCGGVDGQCDPYLFIWNTIPSVVAPKMCFYGFYRKLWNSSRFNMTHGFVIHTHFSTAGITSSFFFSCTWITHTHIYALYEYILASIEFISFDELFRAHINKCTFVCVRPHRGVNIYF